MDGGFPFCTEPNILGDIISTRNLATELLDKIPDTIGGVSLPDKLLEGIEKLKSKKKEAVAV